MSSKETFIKFPKIELLETADNFPTPNEARHSMWFAIEKIDGCNIGMHIPIDEKEPVRFYSRNGQDADGLFNFKEDKKQLEGFIRDLREFCTIQMRNQQPEGVYNPFCDSLYLWGEYFGSNVNKRIDYGVDGSFKFYNFEIDGTRIESPSVFNDFFGRFCFNYPESKRFILFSERVDSYEFKVSDRNDLMNAFTFPTKSGINPNANAEGFVFTRMPMSDMGFDRWKWKDPSFSERPCVGAKKTELDDDYESLHSDFMRYVNENRAFSVISKTPERNIGKLCGLLIKDAKEDFLHDNMERIKGKSDDYMKKVYNIGSHGFLTIKTVLAELKSH